MPNYKGVSYIPDTELLKLTDERLAELKIAYENVETHNKQVRIDLVRKYQEICKLANEVWGHSSKEYKYISKAGAPYDNHRIDFAELTRRIEDARKKDAAALRQQQDKLDAAKHLDAAIAFLLERGKVFGTDFTSESAIDDAHSVKFDELVTKATHDGKLHSFNGDDNCEGCSGWDGISRRCQCGNRRVSWSSEGDFTDMYIYGEAY